MNEIIKKRKSAKKLLPPKDAQRVYYRLGNYVMGKNAIILYREIVNEKEYEYILDKSMHHIITMHFSTLS